MHARILASLLLLGVGTALASTSQHHCPRRNINKVHTGTGWDYQPSTGPATGKGPGDGNGNGLASYTGACGIPFDLSMKVACVHPGWKKALCGQEVQVWNTTSKASVTVRVTDVCDYAGPEAADISCKDIVFSSDSFIELGGDIVTGLVPGGVKWQRVQK